MNLSGIVYLSNSSVPFTTADLQALADSAWELNKQYGITGFLFFDRGYFLQYIEGDFSAVSTLMANIRGDHRHTVVYELLQNGIPERRHGNWHMRLIKEIISLELVLTNYLKYMASYPLTDKHESKQKVWRMVNKITKHH